MGTHHLKPGPPGDILEHHGVKGMHWGIRKEEETSGSGSGAADTSAKAQQQMLIETTIGNPIGTQRSGMSTAQRNALIGLGVLGAAGAGYLAYSQFKRGTFFPGGKKPPEWDVSGLKHGPISDVDLTKGGFSEKYPMQALKTGTATTDVGDYYDIDHSRGYANYIPKNGYATPFAKARHEDLMATFDEMRAKYPSVRNLKVEMVPMSEVPGMMGMEAQGAIAAVMPLGKGEARIMYNDRMEGFGGASREATEAFVPGMFKDKYVGYHEMGHILAVAHGDMPPMGKLANRSPDDVNSVPTFTRFVKDNIKYGAAGNVYHKDTFKRHGFSFEELSKLGGYAATDPRESMAELFGHYSHPEMRQRLTPDQLTRAEAMFNEMGGLT